MIRFKPSTIRRAAVLVATALLVGCASSASTIGESRPAPAQAPVDPYREFARGQETSIQESGAAEQELAIRASAQLPTLLKLALERNPEIQRARSEWKVAVEKVPQASALPDPSVGILHFIENVETRTGPQENVFTLTQKIPFPGKLMAADDVASKGAQIASVRYSATVRDVLVAVKTAYYEYVYLTKARALVVQNVGIAERLAGLGSDLYAKDNALLIDVLKAQSQLAQLQYDLITLTELTSAEKTRLNGLLDRPPEAPIGTPGAAPFPRLNTSVEDLFSLAAGNREEIEIQNLLVEQATARESLAKSQYGPDLTIGGTYLQVGENTASPMTPEDSGKDAYGVMVGLTIPLWVNRTSAGVREARAARVAAERGKTAVWNQTFTSLKDAYFRLTNAERLVLLYRDSLIPQAKQVMLSMEEASRENRQRLGDYLEAQSVWLNFTLAQERALVDYNQAIARIERLTGAGLMPATEEEGR